MPFIWVLFFVSSVDDVCGNVFFFVFLGWRSLFTSSSSLSITKMNYSIQTRENHELPNTNIVQMNLLQATRTKCGEKKNDIMFVKYWDIIKANIFVRWTETMQIIDSRIIMSSFLLLMLKILYIAKKCNVTNGSLNQLKFFAHHFDSHYA